MKFSGVMLAFGVLMMAVGVTVGARSSQGLPRQTGGQEDVLVGLLAEVRGLRAAMEQMASAGPRVQLALGRVQLQEQRVNTLLRRREENRAHLADAQRSFDDVQKRLREIEASLREPGPTAETEALRRVQRSTEGMASGLSADVQRWAAEVAAIEGDLAAEQQRWVDLNQRMEGLEQSLVRR